MNTRHKYADVIKAWADGKQIQRMTLFGNPKVDWHDWYDELDPPQFSLDYVWRIKPEVEV